MPESPITVDAWVESAADLPVRDMRRAMRLILCAIADSSFLRSKMVIKGGVLLDIKYRTGRFTKDVDFSTEERYQSFDEKPFFDEFQKSLDRVSAAIDPGLACRIQSQEVKPKSPERNFQTLKIKIAYCERGSGRQFERFRRGQGSTVVQLDYSFNEITRTVDRLVLRNGTDIPAYTLSDQVGEKYRALLQQIASRRDRVRRQDAYDLYRLISRGLITSSAEKVAVLASLQEKCESRGFSPDRDSILDPEIRSRSAAEYQQLAYEVEETLPVFDEVFDVVASYYLSLPW